VTPVTAGSPSKFKLWVQGARPRTLPAAIVPVLVGTSVSWWWLGAHHLQWWKAVAALVVSLAVQIGTNFANDYSDGIRGTDEVRVGPVRLVASKIATPKQVALASIAFFGIAAVVGLVIAAYTSWWLIAVGAGCIAAGWLYTGGPKPYGYMGLGEVFVFVFFGLVATCGTSYVEGVAFSTKGFHVALLCAVAAGMLAVALLEANNLRDIAGDTDSNKRTLAVRLGRRRAGFLYLSTILISFAAMAVTAAAWRTGALLGLLAAPLALRPTRLALSEKSGRDLLPMLAGTARLQIYAGLLLAIGILI
jgi:1,4-dihydroxy-2-naphthoate octaprenyltransferase